MTALQLWGGLFYLLNKVFFACAEHSESKQAWRIASWLVYIAGLPAWLAIFYMKHNWIAFGVEIGGLPSMFLGLLIAMRILHTMPHAERCLNTFAKAAICIGIGLSLCDFGGFTTRGQFLELGISVGFLIGTYKLAHEKPSGYLWFLLMNASCAGLMWIQGFSLLTLQQITSFGVVADAYIVNKRRKEK